MRSGEKLALRVSKLLRPLIPAKLRAIRAEDVAAPWLREVPQVSDHRIMLSGAMQT